jgi:D-arabinose 1-dehydrogenase-like Zn-dependent alcohol dehydrogenase
VLGSDVAGQVVMAREGGKARHDKHCPRDSAHACSPRLLTLCVANVFRPQFKAYDKVFALTDGYLGKPDSRGTYAEYVLVREDWAARVPDALPLNIAGAVPLVALTAWQARARRESALESQQR